MERARVTKRSAAGGRGPSLSRPWRSTSPATIGCAAANSRLAWWKEGATAGSYCDRCARIGAVQCSTRVVGVPDQLDLVDVLRPVSSGTRDPSVFLGSAESWKAARLPTGEVTARFRRMSNTSVEVCAWGLGADELLERAPDWIGVTDDLTGFDPSSHPLVAELARRRAGLRFGASGLVVERLLPTILGQLVTSLEAKQGWYRVMRRLAAAAPRPTATEDAGPQLTLPPAPAQVAALSAAELHELGIERMRGDTLRRAARVAPRLERLSSLPSSDAQAALCALPGVGVWTAAIVAASAFGDPDAVPVGDYGLPRKVTWFLAGEWHGDDDRMLELLAPFAGHRARVLRLLGPLGKPPRRAPRMRIRDIRGW